MTWQSVHLVVGAEAVLGAEDGDAAAGPVQAGDAPLAAFDFLVGVGGVGDDDQQAGGAGGGEAEFAVEGVDRAAEPLGAVAGAEVGDPGGGLCRARSGRGPSSP